MRPEWRDFSGGVWEREINVRDFIQKNYTPYDGDDTFLAGPTQATRDLWAQVDRKRKRSWRCAGYGYENCFHHHIPRPRLPG